MRIEDSQRKDAEEISELTVEQLQRLANEPAEAAARLAAVLHALTGSDEEIQWASETLENCGQPPSHRLAAIAELTRHPAELVAAWACKLIARSGPEACWTEPFLTAALSARTEKSVREEAARALGRIGARSVAAREALATAARQGGPRLKRLATASLSG